MYWINRLFNELDEKPACWESVSQINSRIGNMWKDVEWEEKLREANNGILVIRDVEHLTLETQSLLFEFLSTTKGGLYGLKEKVFTIRIVFTSTLPIEKLKKISLGENATLTPKFFDRISQMVSTLPSFAENKDSILSDFIATWKEMDFPLDKRPKEIESWLENHSQKFHGNFRDLQKIAINCRQYQLMDYDRHSIERQLHHDFFQSLYFPDQTQDSGTSFIVNTDEPYHNIDKNFKKFIKALAIKKYGKLNKAPDNKPFGMSYRTMEAW